MFGKGEERKQKGGNKQGPGDEKVVKSLINLYVRKRHNFFHNNDFCGDVTEDLTRETCVAVRVCVRAVHSLVKSLSAD